MESKRITEEIVLETEHRTITDFSRLFRNIARQNNWNSRLIVNSGFIQMKYLVKNACALQNISIGKLFAL